MTEGESLAAIIGVLAFLGLVLVVEQILEVRRELRELRRRQAGREGS